MGDFFLVTKTTKMRMGFMRVLIQSTITFFYLMDRDSVTQNPDEARDFKHASKAMRFIKQYHLNNVQIVLKFPKTSDDVNLAILELLDKEQRRSTHKMQTAESF